MPHPRFFCASTLSPGAHIKLPEAVARHAIKALRLQVGDSLCLFNGNGSEYVAILEHIQKEEVSAVIGSQLERTVESPCQITLVQALQAADKMDYTIQKAVELGASSIQPVNSRRSVVRLSGDRVQKRVQHWQGIAIAACEQCGRNTVPAVNPILDLPRWLETAEKKEGLRLVLTPDAAKPLSSLPMPTVQSIALLVGAEGGLDPSEIQAAQHAGFISVSLGPRILRTETAGLAALAAIQTLWGDFRP